MSVLQKIDNYLSGSWFRKGVPANHPKYARLLDEARNELRKREADLEHVPVLLARARKDNDVLAKENRELAAELVDLQLRYDRRKAQQLATCYGGSNDLGDTLALALLREVRGLRSDVQEQTALMEDDGEEADRERSIEEAREERAVGGSSIKRCENPWRWRCSRAPDHYGLHVALGGHEPDGAVLEVWE